MRPALFALASILATACATEPTESSCAAARDYLQSCGIATTLTSAFAASCTERKADELMAVDCATLESAMEANGKGDGVLGWGDHNDACTFDWACGAELVCRPWTSANFADTRCLPLGARLERCMDDNDCAEGLTCGVGTFNNLCH